MPRLERALYVSRASPPTTVEQVRALVGISQLHNRRHDITGALLFTGVSYAQVVEARTDVLDPLLARIQCDRRHTGMQVVWRGPVERRLYARWAMASVFSPAAETLIEALAGAGTVDTDAAHDALRRLFSEDQLGPEG